MKSYTFTFRGQTKLTNYTGSWMDCTSERVIDWLENRDIDFVKIWLAGNLTHNLEILLGRKATKEEKQFIKNNIKLDIQNF